MVQTVRTVRAEYDLSAEQKARRIFFFLKGRSRELYDRMSEEDKGDYDEVKATILKGFNLTAEDYRIKFRTSRRQGNESHKEIVHRLTTYFEKWIRLSGADDTLEEMNFLMMRCFMPFHDEIMSKHSINLLSKCHLLGIQETDSSFKTGI